MERKEGLNHCFICDNRIPWWFPVSEQSRNEIITIPEDMIEGNGVAIDRLRENVCYEVTVRCPCCDNMNKFLCE